jgi:PAS domain S-box-containing protein
LEGSGDGVWDLDLITHAAVHSSQLRRILGFTENCDEALVLESHWESIIHPDDVQECHNLFNRHILGDQPVYMAEYRVKRKDGAYIWVLDRGKVIEWTQDGRPSRVIGTLSDISDRKQAEQRLRDSEARWQFALEGPGDGVWEWNIKTGYTYRSRGWLSMLGYPGEEISAASTEWESRVHPDDLPNALEAMERHMRGKTPAYYNEHRLRCKDGSYKWILARGIVVKWDEDGKPWKMIGTHTDISEWKEAEARLRESEARWQFALEGSGDGVWDFNMITNETFHSRKWKSILGYGDEEVDETIEEWHRRIHPDDYPRCLTLLDEHYQGLTPIYSNEYRVRIKDGSYKWILDRGKVIERTEDGKPLRIIGTCTDISDRKIAEERLRESEERYRTLFERTSNPIVLIDRNGNYIHANTAGCEFLECSLEELLQKNVKDYIPDSREMDYPEELHRAAWEYGGRIETPYGVNGHIKILDLTISPSYWHGLPAVIGVGTDITERVRKEKELKQKNEDITRFSYAVSHDLKSPLVTIHTFLGYLMEDMEKSDSVRVERDLGYIRNAAEKMGKLLDELTEFSRIGRKDNPHTSFKLQEIAGDALKMCAGRINQRGVTVQITGEPLILSGDRKRLVEVFQNLVDNAVKFMGNQEHPCIEIGIERVDGTTALFVRDNGMGVEPKYQGLLFNLFEKLNPSTEGTGMGLALVKRIIEVHGGRIWVYSEGTGKGSTFYFTLATMKPVE